MGKSDKRLSYGTILETEPSLRVHLGFHQDPEGGPCAHTSKQAVGHNQQLEVANKATMWTPLDLECLE